MSWVKSQRDKGIQRAIEEADREEQWRHGRSLPEFHKKAVEMARNQLAEMAEDAKEIAGRLEEFASAGRSDIQAVRIAACDLAGAAANLKVYEKPKPIWRANE